MTLFAGITELLLSPYLVPRWFSFFLYKTQHSVGPGRDTVKPRAQRGPKQLSRSSHLVPPLRGLPVCSPSYYLNVRAVKVGKNGKDVPLVYF